jgi:hypothetical protein
MLDWLGVVTNGVFRRILIVVAVGAILMGLASTPFVWAAPGQSPARQTVPSRTPVAPPTKEEKDKLTPAPTFVNPTPAPWTGTAMPVVTAVPPTRWVRMPPIVVSSATVVSITVTQASTITPVRSTSTVTPTVATMLPTETATGLPAFTPTLAGVLPTQITTRVASDTTVLLPTFPPTRETAAPKGAGLWWVIGLALIVGGAAWVLVRFGDKIV